MMFFHTPNFADEGDDVSIRVSYHEDDQFNGARDEQVWGNNFNCTKEEKSHHFFFPENDNEDIVFINVCGMTYETLASTLSRFPKTLLGDEKRRQEFYRRRNDAIYFDRHRPSFEAILYYYQSGGLLMRPINISMEVFEEEVKFFDLGSETLNTLREKEGIAVGEETDLPLPENYYQRKVWELFEVSESCIAARLITCWSVLVIVTSVILFCLESLPRYDPNNFHNTSCNGTLASPAHEICQVNYIELLEKTCIAWFTFEYVARFLSSPDKLHFAKGVLNIIDIVSILPYLLITAINGHSTAPLAMIRILRLTRILRVFKLSRHSSGLRLMGLTLRASISELGMLALFLVFGLIIFSSAIFYAENEANSDFFPSIPDTFWFTLVTMTTVGYGDKVPSTTVGKLVGGMCAVSGVLMIAMVVPVIVTNFEHFYKAEKVNTRSHWVPKFGHGGDKTVPKRTFSNGHVGDGKTAFKPPNISF